MFNSIHSTTVSLAGVVFRCSGTMSRWNKQVQFLTPRPQLLHPQPPLQSQPTSLTSDSISSQPVVPIIESNPFISQLNPFVHLPSTNIINTLCHLSYTLEQPQTTSPIKICILDVFDGTDLHQLYQFLFQCCFYFCSEPTVFKSDFDKINFAMTYVSGVVQDWLQVALEQENQGVHHAWLYSWSSFVKKIVTINLISYRCSSLCNHMDHFFVSYIQWLSQCLTGGACSLLSVTNFIQLYLHQFFDDSHSLNGYRKPLKRPFDRYQLCLKTISIG